VDHIRKNKEKYIILNTLPVLVWLGNQAALEFHATFNRIAHPNNPEAIVFDLDPSEGQNFEDVAHAALLIRDTLSSLQITSFPKTSGASGLQIYIPVGHRYTYEQARNINGFFGSYFSSKYPHFFTIERTVNKRGRKIYFDYLQMWSNKTIISPYSPRAVDTAAVSTPITWKELEKGCRPEDFTLLNIHSRLKQKGDLFNNLYIPESYQNLSFILENISE
jgi:bifunctional non-homologous end joining protein LigD